jgi:hypothetical protein
MQPVITVRSVANPIVILLILALLGLWLYLGARYVGPNRRWFDRYAQRDVLVAQRQGGLVGRLMAHLPARPQLLRQVVLTWAMMLSGRRTPWGMWRALFEPDPDPEIELLRREAAARARPMIRMLAVFAGIWVFVALSVVLVLLLHSIFS